MLIGRASNDSSEGNESISEPGDVFIWRTMQAPRRSARRHIRRGHAAWFACRADQTIVVERVSWGVLQMWRIKGDSQWGIQDVQKMEERRRQNIMTAGPTCCRVALTPKRLVRERV